MSRTPPASLRVTGNLLNFSQVAVSLYYYVTHLKGGIALEKITTKLSGNTGFPTSTITKRKALPLLVLGILPITTQLRAKQYYNRLLRKSRYWWKTKLFRGAQSILSHHWDGDRKAFDRATPSSLLQRIIALKSKVRLVLSATGKSKSIASKRPLDSGIRRKHLLTMPVGKNQMPSSFLLFQPYSKSKEQKEQKPLPQKMERQRDSGPQRLRPWSTPGWFALFCIEQMIGKKKLLPSCNLVGLHNSSLTKIGTPLHKSRRSRLRYIERVEDLDGQLLSIERGAHFPKSTVRYLDQDLVNVSEKPRNQKNLSSSRSRSSKAIGQKTQLRLSGNSLIRQVKTNVTPKCWIQHTFNAPARFNLLGFVEGHIASHQQSPLKAFPRHQRKNMHKSLKGTVLQKSSVNDNEPVNAVGAQRLKSGFVFELSLRNGTSGTNLRPTISLRL